MPVTYRIEKSATQVFWTEAEAAGWLETQFGHY